MAITFKEVEFESDDWNLWAGKVKVTNAVEAAIRRLTINLYGPHSLCTEYRNFEHKSIITILIVDITVDCTVGFFYLADGISGPQDI